MPDILLTQYFVMVSVLPGEHTMIQRLILLAFALVVSATPAMAAQGKAIIPHWFSNYAASNNYYNSIIYVSNITDATVSITITLYKEDGSIVTDDGSVSTGAIVGGGNVTSYNDSVSGTTATFDLAAQDTGHIIVSLTTGAEGYGVIEYSQSSENVHCVVAHGQSRRLYTASSSFGWDRAVTINGGMPF